MKIERLLECLAGAAGPMHTHDVAHAFGDDNITRVGNFLRWAAREGYIERTGEMAYRRAGCHWQITPAGRLRLADLTLAPLVSHEEFATDDDSFAPADRLPPRPPHPLMRFPVFATCSLLGGVPAVETC